MPEDALGIYVPEEDEGPDTGDLMAIEEAAAEAGWPGELEKALGDLRQVKPERVVNTRWLGEDLAFTGADAKVAKITQILTDLREEEWAEIQPETQQQVIQEVQATIQVMRQMAELRPSQPDFQTQHDSLASAFESHYSFFVGTVRPLCLSARVAEVLQRRRDSLVADFSDDRINALQDTFQELQKEAEQFKELAPVIETQREFLGKAGVSDLSASFTSLAAKSKEEFKAWGKWLALALLGGGALAVFVVWIFRPPDDASNAQIASRCANSLLSRQNELDPSCE
jgi:hypothetical protein